MNWVYGRLSTSGERCNGLRKKFSYVGIFLCLILSSSITVRAKDALNVPPVQEDGIPEDIREICEEVGEEYDICPELLEAIAYHESRFKENVTNGSHYGLCQVNVNVHKFRMDEFGYTNADMTTAFPNIKVAADYLADLFETYEGDDYMVMCLYAGFGNKAVKRYKETGRIPKCVEDILNQSAEYERLHGK